MLEPGECRLESENQIVDTDINYQFGEIKKNLLSAD
jgi:flagellar biosynthesis/type III secretory pathway protein FliH